MTRILPLLFLGLAFLSSAQAGDGLFVAPGHRSAILASVNEEFLRVQPCGIATGPSRYLVEHLAIEDEWACIAGSARYEGHTGPFAVKFIALLKWDCGCWQVSSISFDAANVSRRKLVGMRQVPSAILPRWIRWSP